MSILTFGDCTITQPDLDLAKSPTSWFNDSLLSFYLELLSPRSSSQNISLLSPSAAFALRYLDPQELLASGRPDTNVYRAALRSRLVLIPLNNAQRETQNGTHWSLLVFDGNRTVHVDSMREVNARVAGETTEAVRKLFGMKELRCEELKDAPQQENGCDCGVFVLMNVQNLVGREEDKVVLDRKGAVEFRKRVAEAIEEHIAKLAQ